MPTTHPNAALIERFYTAFRDLDYPGMIACYDPEVVFSDPAFGELRGWRAGAMWRMLTSRAKDLELEFSGIEADDTEGRATWVARYTFTGTGRKVENHIQARFRFRDGRIIEHHDTFDLWRWSRMALGVQGLLLGWSPIVRNAVRKQALGGLESYIEKNSIDADNVASR